jgi:hypothetical protein
MTIYYFTFGQDHKHPKTGEPMKDYWIEIDAKNAYDAQIEMRKRFGQIWANQYDARNFNLEYFPKGCYKRFVAYRPLYPRKWETGHQHKRLIHK